MQMIKASILIAALISLTSCSYFQRATDKISSLFPASAQKGHTADAAPPSEQSPVLQNRAELGDAEAQYKLGMSYCCGAGAGYNEQLARKWLCRAGIQQHAAAQYELGRLYETRTSQKRLSMPQYLEESYMWYHLSSAHGHPLAETYRNALERDMTAGQIKRALKRAEHFEQIDCDK